MPKHCQKFHLTQEEDKHYFSGIDGSMFLPANENFHTNDQYCVDYFYYADELDPTVDLVKVSCSLVKLNTQQDSSTIFHIVG